MFKHILVAVDGSDHARAALDTACKLSSLTGAALHLVHVPQPAVDSVVVGYTAVPLPPTQEEIAAEGARVLSEAEAEAEVKSLGAAIVTSAVVTGDPATAIVEEAAKNGVDLIVMGRRGLGRLTGLLIGSTTAKVAQLAPCAVMTVK